MIIESAIDEAVRLRSERSSQLGSETSIAPLQVRTVKVDLKADRERLERLEAQVGQSA